MAVSVSVFKVDVQPDGRVVVTKGLGGVIPPDVPDGDLIFSSKGALMDAVVDAEQQLLILLPLLRVGAYLRTDPTLASVKTAITQAKPARLIVDVTASAAPFAVS